MFLKSDLHNINNGKVASVIIFLPVCIDKPRKAGDHCNLLKRRSLLTILSIDQVSTVRVSQIRFKQHYHKVASVIIFIPVCVNRLRKTGDHRHLTS